MKKIFKRIVSLLLAAVMVFGVAPLSGFVGLELPNFADVFNIKVKAATSGTCGENLIWEFDETTGELVISGTGAMEVFSYYTAAPWYSYNSFIKTVNIANGVTSIGDWAFCEYEHLESVTISNSVVKIGDCAFRDCTSLSEIKMSDNIAEIGLNTFYSTAYYNDKSNWENGFLYIENCLIRCDLMLENGVTEIKVKDGTSVLGDGAFTCLDLANAFLLMRK